MKIIWIIIPLIFFLTINIEKSFAADSQAKELYVGGYSSGGFQEVYKIPYDVSSYEMIGTNKGLR